MTRRRLLLAASRLIDERGFRGAGLNEIVEASGFSKGALYFHFGAKEDLADALVAEVFASWDDVLAQVAALGLDPLQALLVCYDLYTARLMCDVSARAALRVVQDGVGRHHAHRWASEWEAISGGFLSRAAGEGILRASIDPEWLSGHLLAVTQGHFTLSRGSSDGRSMWQRMNATWVGLLPSVASAPWLHAWRASGWDAREEPRVEHFDFEGDTAGAVVPTGT